MQGTISTNVVLPEEMFRALKIKAAQEGKSMKQLIAEGLSLILTQKEKPLSPDPAKSLLLKFSGKVKAEVSDGSIAHDNYLYKK